jgi:tape measure domain-containing protein
VAGDLTFKSTFEVNEAIDQLVKLKNAGIAVADDLARELNRKLGGKDVEKVVAIRTTFDDKGQLQYKKVTKEILNEYDKIANAIAQAEKVQRGSVTSLRQQVNAAKQLRDATAKYEAGLDGIRSKVNGVTPAWIAQNEKVRQLQSELAKVDGSPFWDRIKGDLGVGGLISFTNGLTQLVQGFQAVSIVVGQVTGSVNKLTSALADLQQFELAFKAIGLGAGGAATGLSESTRIAGNLGVNLAGVRDSFQQLSPVITNAGGSISDVSNIVEALSSRFAAFGIAGDRARRVTNGVIQAFAKGKLQAEELTQQISEADPAFKTDFANALGVSVTELEKLVKAGEINIDVLIATLPLLSKSGLLYGKLGTSALDASAQLDKGAVTIDQVRAKLDTLSQLSFEQFAKTIEPALNAFIRIRAVITDFLASVSKAGALNALAGIFNSITSAVSDLARVFTGVAQGFLVALEPLAALVNALLKIPGVSQLIGAAIIGKVITPLAALKASLVKTLAASDRFGAGFFRATQSSQAFGNALQSFFNPARQAAQEVDRLSATQARLAEVSQRVQGRLGGLKQQLGTTKKALLDIIAAGPGTKDPLSQKLGASDFSKETTALKAKIASLTSQIERYEGVAGRLSGKTLQNAQSLKVASAAASAKAGAFGRLGGVVSNVGNVLTAGLNGAVGAARSLLAVLGPIGVAFIALGAVQSAYASATAEVSSEIERGKAALKSYQDLVKEISGQEAAPPKLSALESAWQEFGLSVAEVVRAISATLDALVDKLQSIQGPISSAFDKLPEPIKKFATAANRSLNPLAFILEGLGNSSDETSLKIRKFALQATESFKNVGQQVQEIQALVEAIRKLSGEAGDDTEKKANVVAQYEKAKKLVEATRGEVERLQQQIKGFEQEEAKGTLSGEGKEKLKELREQLDQAKSGLNVASAAFRKLGIEIGAIDDEQLKALVGTLGILSERAKELQERLAQAPKGSKEFGVFAALLQAVTDETEELQKAAQDPVVLRVGVEDALTEKVAELGEEYEKLRKEQEKPPSEIQDDKIAETRKRIADLRAEVERLNKLKVRLDLESGDTFDNVNRKIQELEKTASRVRFDSSEFREAISELQTERNRLDRLTSRRLLVEVGVLESRGTNSLGNVQQQISKLEQAKVLLPVDSPDLPFINAKLQELRDRQDAINTTDAIAQVDIIEGQGTKNLGNLQKQIQLLQGALVTIPVDSPDIPKVISQLIEAEQRANAINGLRAEIEIGIREQQLSTGAAPLTLSNLDKLVEGYNRKQIVLPITSPGIDEVITKLEKIQRIRDLGAKSNAQLQKQLFENEKAEFSERNTLVQAQATLEKDKNREVADERKRQIQSASEAESRAFDERIARINAEISAIQRVADARLAALRAETPAERALQKLRKQGLSETARSGSTAEERLQARAQLERIAADERASKIAEEAAQKKAKLEEQAARLAEEKAAAEEQAKERIRKIDEQIRIEEKQAREEDRKFREESLKLQQETLKLAQQDRKEQNETINKILKARTEDGSSTSLVEALVGSGRELDAALAGFAAIATDVEAAATDASKVSARLEDAGGAAGGAADIINNQMLEGLKKSAEQVKSISDQLRALDGLSVNVRVIGIPGRATGGPTTAGQVYQVNELGQEGFLSSAGRLAPIEKPKNALWKAPSSGTVIPAHLWAKMDVPKGGVKVANAKVPAASGDSKMTSLVRQIQASLAPDSRKDEIAAVQAQQAVEIGKLGRAVDKLAAKKWDVHVGLNNGSSNGYLNALNRLL